MKGVDGTVRRRRAARSGGRKGTGIVQRTGRKANNNNNYLIRVDGGEGKTGKGRGKGRKGLTRVRNICNGLFYSSDLSAAAELMAAEISRGNETIGIRSAMRRNGGGRGRNER